MPRSTARWRLPTGPPLLGVVLLCCWGLGLVAAEIRIVSEPVPALQQCATAITNELDDSHRLHLLTLQEAQAAGSAEWDTTDLTIAVGPRASVWLDAHLGQGRLVTCMHSAATAAALEQTARWSLSTSIPLADQLAVIRDGLPATRRLGMLYDSRVTESAAIHHDLSQALPRDWSLIAVDLAGHDQRAGAIDTLLDRRPDLVWTAPDPAVFDRSTVKALLLAALRHRIPVFGFSDAFVRSGAVVGIGISPVAHGAQVATICSDVLADRPIADHTPRFQVFINPVVASKLRIRLGDALLDRVAAQEDQ